MKKLKKVKLSLMLGLLLILTTSSTCSNDDDTPSNGNNPNDVIAIVNNGTWRITYYFDNNQVETNNYNGYNFTFGTNNVLTATNGTNTITGFWSVTDSNSNDDSSFSDLDFNIAFTAPPFFEELTDDWEILEKSATLIKLKDVSGGNGGIDYLTFTKN
jgi:hypothetical protein